MVTRHLDPLAAQWHADLTRPASAALGLPGAAYTSAEYYERERETVFAAGWIAAAVASEIPRAGDALVRSVAGHPVIFVRDRNGELRCFHNICRHRGMALATQACSDLRFLQCPWHGWIYGLDGKLNGTPEFGGPAVHEVAGFERRATGLIPVRLARWFDFLFINFDDAAPPLEQYLLPLVERFPGYRQFSAFRYAQSWRHAYEGNWKLCMEGAIEDYHLPSVHPQITQGRKRADRSSVECSDAFFLVSSENDQPFRGRTPPGFEPLPQVAGLRDTELQTICFLNIFPTGVMGIAPDGLYLGTWLPDGPQRTELSFHFYFVGEEAARGERYRASREHWIGLIQGVFLQDTPLVKAVQERARARDELGLRTRFSPFWESAVLAFQRRVHALVMRGSDLPAATSDAKA